MRLMSVVLSLILTWTNVTFFFSLDLLIYHRNPLGLQFLCFYFSQLRFLYFFYAVVGFISILLLYFSFKIHIIEVLFVFDLQCSICSVILFMVIAIFFSNITICQAIIMSCLGCDKILACLSVNLPNATLLLYPGWDPPNQPSSSFTRP